MPKKPLFCIRFFEHMKKKYVHFTGLLLEGHLPARIRKQQKSPNVSLVDPA
jgi:hypothetical protein